MFGKKDPNKTFLFTSSCKQKFKFDQTENWITRILFSLSSQGFSMHLELLNQTLIRIKKPVQ